jgi:BirA family biotin operon repressor/biotin-[acetyl-CoA-carboxylase] ligase
MAGLAHAPDSDDLAAPEHEAAAVRELLAGRGLACTVQCVTEIGSTNAELVARARRAAPAEPWLLSARHQSAGRGRLGRRWSDAGAGSLLFSLAWPVAPSTAELPGVTLACGVAAARVCAAHGVPARIKWPNDLWLGEGKLAGLLAELAVDAAGERTLVLGLGLNLWLEPALARALDAPAAALESCLPRPELAAQRALWLADLAAALIEAGREHQRSGLASFLADYARLDALAGRTVTASRAGEPGLAGTAAGIDAQGRLRIDTRAGPVLLAGGEISVRPAP